MTNKLPFKITPTVKRYVNEIFDFCSDWEKEQLNVPFPIPEILEIQTLQKDLGDKFTTESENNRCDFIHFLEKEGVIRYFEHLEDFNKNNNGILDYPSGTQEPEVYPEIMRMQILDIKPLQKIKEEHPELFPRNQSLGGDSKTITEKKGFGWDNKERILVFKGIKHKFQSPTKRSYHFLLIENLWKDRKETGGTQERKGELRSHNEIAYFVGKTLSLKSSDVGGKLTEKIESFNDILKRKKIKIEIKGGEGNTQIVVTL